MTEGAWVTGLKELLTLPDRDLSPEMLEERGRSYRKHLNCLTDRQWQHAVAEAVRLEKFFPAAATLLEYGDSAPAKLLDWTGECGLCDGSGFEPFERGGYSFVRYCPRGCKVGEKTRRPDYRSDTDLRAEAKRGLAQIRAALRKRGIEVTPPEEKVIA